jgi:hypothetical protein
MPKSKKAKTKHNGSKANGDSSQAEIWDDSALIRSWNDAVAEYEVRQISVRKSDIRSALYCFLPFLMAKSRPAY